MGKWDERKLRLGDTYFSEGDYEKSFHYYRKYLKNLKKTLSDSDDKVVIANIKVGDVEVMLKNPLNAVVNYRSAIKELKIKKEAFEEEGDDSLEYVIEQYISVLLNCGNVYLQMSKDKEIKRDAKNVDRNVNFAIEVYVEAWPLASERYGYNTSYLKDVATQFCSAREVLANSYIKGKKPNLAEMQYDLIVKLLKPFVEEEAKTPPSSNKKKLFEYLLLKHTISLGLLYLRQNRTAMVLEVFENALEAIGLGYDDFDKQQLDKISPKTKSLVSNLFHNMGIVCQKMHLNEAAVSHFEKGIKIKRNIGGSAGISILASGECYYALKEYDKALLNFITAKEELNFDAQTVYKEPYDVCLSNIASIYEQKGDIDNSITYLNNLISLLQRCLNGEIMNGKLASVWNRIAFIYFGLGRYDESLDAYNTCLLCKTKLGDESKLTETLQHIGLVHSLCGRYEMAFDSYEEGLEYSHDETQKLSISYELGEVLSNLNRYQEALQYYEKCFSLGTALIISDGFCTSTVAKCVCQMGTILIQFGEPTTAIRFYEKANKSLNSKRCNKEKIDVLVGLGNAHLILSNNDAAMHYSLEAKYMVLKDESLDYEVNKKCFFLMASVYEQKMDIPQSIACLEELKYCTRTSVKDIHKREVELAAILDRMASIKFGAKMNGEALKHYKEALSTKKNAYNIAPSDDSDVNEDIAFTLSRIGQVYFEKKMIEDALDSFREALTKVEGTTKASVLIDIGKVLGSGSRYQEALDNFLSALSLVKDVNSKETYIQQTVLNCIGSFYAQVFRFDEAVEYYEKAHLIKNPANAIDPISRCLEKSNYKLGSNIDAIQFFETNKRNLDIKAICSTYDEFDIVLKALLNHFATEKDFDSCVTCISYSLNLAKLFIHDKIELGFEFANSFHMMASAFQQKLNYNCAVRAFELSLSIKRMLYSDKENSDTSFTYSGIGELYIAKGEYQNALNNLREALKGADDDVKPLLLDRIGIVLRQMKQYAEAKECYQSSLVLCGNKLLEQRVLLLNNLGNINICLGNVEEAMYCYIEALSLKTTNQNLNEDAKCIFLNVGTLHYNKKCYDKSVDSFKSFLSSRIQTIASSHENSFDRFIMSSVLNHIGTVLVKKGDFEEAIEWFTQSIELLKSSPTRSFVQLHETLSYLGNAYYYLYEYDTALSYYNETIKLVKEQSNVDDNQLASLLDKTAGIRFKMKDYDSAMHEYKQALELKNKKNENKKYPHQRLITLHNIALVHCKKHEYMDAIKILKDVKEKKMFFYGSNHPEIAKILIDLGNISYKLREYQRADAQYKQASRMLSKANYPRNHSYQIEIGKAFIKMKKYNRSQSFVYRAMQSTRIFKTD